MQPVALLGRLATVEHQQPQLAMKARVKSIRRSGCPRRTADITADIMSIKSPETKAHPERETFQKNTSNIPTLQAKEVSSSRGWALQVSFWGGTLWGWGLPGEEM